jgi:hypothetical protein
MQIQSFEELKKDMQYIMPHSGEENSKVNFDRIVLNVERWMCAAVIEGCKDTKEIQRIMTAYNRLKSEGFTI